MRTEEHIESREASPTLGEALGGLAVSWLTFLIGAALTWASVALIVVDSDWAIAFAFRAWVVAIGPLMLVFGLLSGLEGLYRLFFPKR